MMQPSGGGGMGMMGTMASSMAGSMAGSMIGHSLSGMMSGGAPAAQPAAAQQPTPAQAWAQSPQYGSPPSTVDPCMMQHKEFMMCMSSTGDNLDQCRHLFDAFKSCNLHNGK